MFESFFPKPKIFFLTAAIWCFFSVLIWFFILDSILIFLNFPEQIKIDNPIIGLGHFVTYNLIKFYVFYIVMVGIFSIFWFKISPHKWQLWSIVGSAFILFSTYFNVQVMVAINSWRRPFFDSVQTALSGKSNVTSHDLYELILIFAEIAFLAVVVYVVTRFFVSHYIFRWRSAMNEFYTERWKSLRKVEGASQRIQEDTMRFAGIMENLGVAIVDSIMTLFAFLPILLALSIHINELPLIGKIPAPLLNAAIFWSIFGTVLLSLAGIKLPGLEFKNQRVEAAFRKELVYGEDDDRRAEPLTLKELFLNIRKNYFRLYFHYMYFNIFRSFYMQADNIFGYLILIPTIALGKITFGILQQILTAFSQVSNSFQYLVNAWPTIIELISIFKRLNAFEATLKGIPLTKIDEDYLKDNLEN